jgi:hypothetical protein
LESLFETTGLTIVAASLPVVCVRGWSLVGLSSLLISLKVLLKKFVSRLYARNSSSQFRATIMPACFSSFSFLARVLGVAFFLSAPGKPQYHRLQHSVELRIRIGMPISSCNSDVGKKKFRRKEQHG